MRPDKGSIARIENGEVVYVYSFQHNPSDFSRSRTAKWIDLQAPGQTGSMVEFVNVSNQTIKFELFLSSWSTETVFDPHGLDRHLAEMESWTLPSLDLFLADTTPYIQPPTLRFQYGGRSWLCTCRSIDIKEEEHNKQLYCTRARVSLTLKTQTNSFLSLQEEMSYLAARRIEWS